MTEATPHPELTITRVFNAPRSLVWEVWTDPKHAAQWWGPKGFTNPVYEADLRPGGRIRVDMRGPDGTVHSNAGVYEEVVEPERLVTHGTVQDEGKTWLEVRTVVIFEACGDKTAVTVHQTYLYVAPEMHAALEGAPIGWNQSLDRLEERLAATTFEGRLPAV